MSNTSTNSKMLHPQHFTFNVESRNKNAYCQAVKDYLFRGFHILNPSFLDESFPGDDQATLTCTVVTDDETAKRIASVIAAKIDFRPDQDEDTQRTYQI